MRPRTIDYAAKGAYCLTRSTQGMAKLMNRQSAEPNGIAIAVFGVTLLALVGPALSIPEVVPFGIAAGGLGVAAVDRIIWQGRLAQLLSAQLAWRSPQHRRRVLLHEAGHLVAACALEIPILGCVLDPWQAFRQGYPGYGGVQLDNAQWQQYLQQGKVSRSEVERYCIVWMAGGVAERAELDSVAGDRDDRLQVRQLVSLLRRGGQSLDPGYMERWARIGATALLERQADAYRVAVDCLERNLPLNDSLAEIRAALVAPENAIDSSDPQE